MSALFGSDGPEDSPDRGEARDILKACVHCGFCNAVCPTYQLLGDELDGPRGRIDLIMDVKSGKVAPTSQPAEEFFYKAYNVSYWTMPREDAVEWLNTQFGTNVE